MPSRDIEPNQLMIQALSRKLESIPLMIQTAFQELAQNQLMTQVHLPDIDSATHDSNCLPIFRLKSAHGSSEKHLILSRLMIRL